MTLLLTRDSVATASQPRIVPAWLREPLLNFVVLGAVLFGADHFLVAREDDPRVIVVGQAVDDEATRIFAASRGRPPTDQELGALRRAWLDNEVLYREGLALQVDRGDTAIRERVIFKALSIVDSNVAPPKIDEKKLRAWFESHRAGYDEPPRFDFQEAVLTGEATEALARALCDRLNGGVSGDVEAGLRVFKGRPRDNLVQSYGEPLAGALETSPVGEWRAQSTKDGWRVLRLESITPAKPADFEAVGGTVLQDWIDVTAADQRTAAVRALAAKYTIKYEKPTR